MQNSENDRKVGPSVLMGTTAKCDVGMLGLAVNCGEGRGRGDSGDKRHRDNEAPDHRPSCQHHSVLLTTQNI